MERYVPRKGDFITLSFDPQAGSGITIAELRGPGGLGPRAPKGRQ